MSLPTLAREAAQCQNCELYRDATQTVFGAGPGRAAMVLVGEQPGDVEDRRGEPFVGPAGKLLDRALAEAGIDRAEVYLTNAVKHFRYRITSGNARRLHRKPDLHHVAACRPWLSAELDAIAPATVVLLGATAAAAVFGSGFRLTQHRGQVLDWPADGPLRHTGSPRVVATLHPSAVLRGDNREELRAGLVADLRLAAG